MIENWVVIKEFPNYEISDCGNCRRLAPSKGTSVGKYLSSWESSNGYLYVSLRKGNRNYNRRTSILVCEAFIGPKPFPNAQAAHLDGVKHNNNYENLAWKSRSENEKDKIVHGTSNRGERNGSSIINSATVKQIRSLVNGGMKQADVARLVNVSFNQVSRIVRGVRWGWME